VIAEARMLDLNESTNFRWWYFDYLRKAHHRR
jgi:hypothetical protein